MFLRIPYTTCEVRVGLDVRHSTHRFAQFTVSTVANTVFLTFLQLSLCIHIDLSKKTNISAFGICSRIVAVVPNVALMVFDIIFVPLLSSYLQNPLIAFCFCDPFQRIVPV